VTQSAPPRRTRLRAEQRRELILEAATEVFAEAGYRAAKMSDVAARLGVTEPVIFQNFGSKAALYAAVLDQVATGIRAHLESTVREQGSAARLLARLLDVPAEGAGHVHEDPHAKGPHAHGPQAPGQAAHAALFFDAVTLATDPGLAEPARSAARTLAGHLADLLRYGQGAGEIRPDVDPEAAAWLLLSVLATRPIRAVAAPGADRLETRVAELALAPLTSG
jgi:AcrR family transcriptional regulator